MNVDGLIIAFAVTIIVSSINGFYLGAAFMRDKKKKGDST